MFEVRQGDCVSLMAAMPAGSVDAVVCDPPYGLEFMGKEWDRLLKAPSGSAHARQHSVSFVNPGNPTCRNCGGLKSLESEGSGGRTKCRCDDPDFPNHLLPRARAMQEWHQAWATEALRVLKPGGHLLAFGGTRTYHRLVCAVEDAGFEIRDTISWLYGSGFPKSLDVSKAIDKLDATAERDERAKRSQGWLRQHLTPQQVNAATGTDMGHHLTTHPTQPFVPTPAMLDQLRPLMPEVPDWLEQLVADRAVESENMKRREVTGERDGTTMPGFAVIADGKPTTWQETLPHTPEAERWEGWGTALAPAHEPIVVARKPLSGTVASTVLEWGTGAINIDASRVGENGQGRWPKNCVLSHTEGCVQVGTRKVKGDGHFPKVEGSFGQHGVYGTAEGRPQEERSMGTETVGAWSCTPDCPVRLLDEQTGELHSQDPATRRGGASAARVNGSGETGWGAGNLTAYADQGGASRFFYVAKASRVERSAGLEGGDQGALRNSHPT